MAAEPRWWTIRRAQNRKPATYRCPFCGELLPALSEHVLVMPEGDPARRRHAHTACALRARRAGRLPAHDEWQAAQPRRELGEPPRRGRRRRRPHVPSLTIDLRPVRESRDLRLLVLGNVVSGLGTQAALVALPYQIYVETRSPLLTGMLGAVELGPLVAMALLGGAIADRIDRRRLLLADQLALVSAAGGLAAAAFGGWSPVWLLYVLGGLLAGFGAVQNVTRSAIVPNLVAPERLRGALALTFGLYQLTMVVGPALGGLLIAALGVGAAYAVDAGSCLAMVAAAYALPPQLPLGRDERPLSIGRSIADGLRFVRGNQALLGSFAIDLMAMTFGMPRALFAVLSLTVYHAGAAGTGALYAAVSAGATIAALTTGWLQHARRLGLIVIWAVAVWGIAIAAAGVTSSLWMAAALLAIAGAADSVSAVCRTTINQTVTPDELRGRMSSVFSLVVTSGPRLGDIEAGTVASLATPRASVISGGVACAAGVLLVMAAFPALLRYDVEAADAARGGSKVPGQPRPTAT
jgi:MFS family permease